MGSEIGEVGAVIDYVVTSNTTNNTLVITGDSFYSTSQTDIMVGAITGTGTQVNPTTFNFVGTEQLQRGHRGLRRHLRQRGDHRRNPHDYRARQRRMDRGRRYRLNDAMYRGTSNLSRAALSDW